MNFFFIFGDFYLSGTQDAEVKKTLYALNIDHLMTISAICCLVCTINITLDLSRMSFEYSSLSQDLTSLESLPKNRSLTTHKIFLTQIRNKEL